MCTAESRYLRYISCSNLSSQIQQAIQASSQDSMRESFEHLSIICSTMTLFDPTRTQMRYSKGVVPLSTLDLLETGLSRERGSLMIVHIYSYNGNLGIRCTKS